MSTVLIIYYTWSVSKEMSENNCVCQNIKSAKMFSGKHEAHTGNYIVFATNLISNELAFISSEFSLIMYLKWNLYSHSF